MKVEFPEENVLIVNDGAFTIVRNPLTGEYALGYANGLAPIASTAGILPHEQADDPTVDDENSFDRVTYMSGGNGLTVAESTQRALIRVSYDIWSMYNADMIGDINILRASVADMIREGMGRQAVYVLAGGIKKGVQSGLYKGVPLAYVFKGFVDGVIEHPSDEVQQAKYPSYSQRDG